MPKISVFNGGLHTAAAAHLIADKESVVNLNMNHISGMIKPLYDKTEAILNAKQWGHFFTTDLSWYFDDNPKDWVEFQERLYIGNRTGFSTKIVNGNEWLMGIVGPTLLPLGVATNETREQNQITRVGLVASTDATSDIPADLVLKYRVVNVSSTGQFYPSDKEFSIHVTSDLSDVDTDYHNNKVTITVEDTNIDTSLVIFRFFDNYWRKLDLNGLPAPTGSLMDATFFDIWGSDLMAGEMYPTTAISVTEYGVSIEIILPNDLNGVSTLQITRTDDANIEGIAYGVISDTQDFDYPYYRSKVWGPNESLEYTPPASRASDTIYCNIRLEDYVAGTWVLNLRARMTIS